MAYRVKVRQGEVTMKMAACRRNPKGWADLRRRAALLACLCRARHGRQVARVLVCRVRHAPRVLRDSQLSPAQGTGGFERYSQ